MNGTITNKWLYAGQLAPVAELDSANNVIARFSGGYMNRNDTIYQIITDHLGSPRLVVNVATGAVVQRMDYDEFGNIIYDSNPGFQPFGFSRGMYESDCGLVFFGARVYDPTVGRWLSPDPIGFSASGTNLYNYVLSDPINNNDPTGLDANTWTYGEVRQWANISPTNYDPAPGLADAKASIAAVCARSVGGCNSAQPGPHAAPGDEHAWQNIVNATGGTDRSGGGNFMCVGSQGCWFVHRCRNKNGKMVDRKSCLTTSGTADLNGHTIYFYNDPLLGNCPDQ
ncbi:MAG: RHS repeat-associated core domain-containing protein [Candidatus Kryptoniota bacterium]